jgi:L-alanine-DL-glutamate epimerase-like enolase superfamily enzyme
VKLDWVQRELLPRRAFRISRGRRADVRNVFVRLEAEGVVGYGEASPNAFYDETWEGVAAKLEAARGWLATVRPASVADLATAWEEAWRLVAPSRAAQCALDLALWDWLARRQGLSACELVWGEAPRAVTSFCTIGLSTPEELAEKVEELREYPRIKIKSDHAASVEPVRFVRNETQAMLAVDANCAWSEANLDSLAPELAALGVEFIEQPLPPGEDARLAEWRGVLPLVADESCVTEDDVERVAQRFAGFNIKLVKCGGITPARRMVQRGRELGRRVMVGCMLESSALIAAGAVMAQRTDYADLDGAWLIGNDPFRGWHFDRGVLSPPAAPGLGAEPDFQF